MDIACIRKQYGPFARQLLLLTYIEFRQIPSSSFGDEIYARAYESVMGRVDISTISLYGKILLRFFFFLFGL
jgi:hypothetical protein